MGRGHGGGMARAGRMQGSKYAHDNDLAFMACSLNIFHWKCHGFSCLLLC